MKTQVLSQKFFERSTITVAKDLLGKYLVRRRGKKVEKFIITEIEAYKGLKDKASHASRRKTKRNAPMFGEAGHWYVYFTYGMHWMLNIVTGPKNYPAAVLIRDVDGINGPARITKQLKIDKKFNNKLAMPKSDLWIEENSKFKNSKFEIRNSPRIGVNYAGPIWSKKKWRFTLINIDKNV
ncbi:hypothetical protein A2819_00590 [Candidatus Azambacteria bacterium RIFCSPHIGHO2_01_FULL_40_24]|uniref:Putative 3-methyladenine DNA glycosylase n=1 Tax=Candidatus Azambacteria bacterium RIFCSPHIGHO2_01_FULL_40_24 TaxID=1797301 RepID=A0A1F5B2M0_9BACT|nr:MAG: hypothetical protein A2819_00590 [Candidatus Azambacteria bacterium RIFCSPHIGHO2_01_FULL_40_24]